MSYLNSTVMTFVSLPTPSELELIKHRAAASDLALTQPAQRSGRRRATPGSVATTRGIQRQQKNRSLRCAGISKSCGGR